MSRRGKNIAAANLAGAGTNRANSAGAGMSPVGLDGTGMNRANSVGAGMNRAGLRAEGIALDFGGAPVLAGVDAQAAPGEVAGLIGPNGAGKTSLLRVLAHLLPPAAGKVSWNGRPLAELPGPERGRLLGYLAQGAPAHWPLAVEKVVELGRIPHRAWWQSLGDADRAAVARAMAEAQIGHLAGRLVTTLSGGERARTMLARIFATQPKVILADEPVASLDPYHQMRVMELLRRRAAEGAAVMVVLHDLNLAARYCDRLLLLANGGIAASGPPAEVLAGEAVAQAFGVTVELRREAGGLWVRLGL